MTATNREPMPSSAMVAASESAQANPSSPIRVRGARSEDLPKIVAVLLASFYPKVGATHWFYWLMQFGIREDIKTRLKTHSSQYACLVAVSVEPTAGKASTVEVSSKRSRAIAAGTVVGTIEISQRPCETWQFFPPKKAYLSNLAIDCAHRRQGAARQLLHSCESVALQWGFHDIYLHVMADNQAAQALYARAGYQPCEVSNPILASLGIRPERLLFSKHLKIETH